MKTLITYLSLFSLILLSILVHGQVPGLDIDGSIQSTELSGVGKRVVVSDENGQLQIGSTSDTLKVGVIQLLDMDGDVRIELNAHEGQFNMMDDDTVFYQVSVQSPPRIIQDHGNGYVTAQISDPTVIEVVRQQLLTNILNAFPMELNVLSDLSIAQNVELIVEIENSDLGLLDIGMPTQNEIKGTLKYLDINGQLQVLNFENTGDQGSGAFTNTLLDNKTKNMSFFLIGVDTNAVPTFPLAGEINHARDGTLGSNFVFQPDVNESFGFNNGMIQNQSGDFNVGVSGMHTDGSNFEAFSLKPGELTTYNGSNNTTLSDGKIEYTNGTDIQDISFNPADNTIESTSYLQTINPADPNNYNQLNPDGFMVQNMTSDETYFSDRFGMSLFTPSNFVGFGFDLPNEKNINEGGLDVLGLLSKLAGSFKIDHPLDPENKWLYHSFVESPDMMNVYNGNTVTDENGVANVTLPEYFETLNMDYRYQLTVIGIMAQAIILEKIENNQFKIKTNLPHVEVSWQVTGIRNDDFARENRIQPEVAKSGKDAGRRIYDKTRTTPYFYKTKENHVPVQQ